ISYNEYTEPSNPVPTRPRRSSIVLSSSAGSIGRPVFPWITAGGATSEIDDNTEQRSRFRQDTMGQTEYFSSKSASRRLSGSYGTVPHAMPPSGLGDHLDATEANLIAQGVVYPVRGKQVGGNGENERL